MAHMLTDVMPRPSPRFNLFFLVVIALVANCFYKKHSSVRYTFCLNSTKLFLFRSWMLKKIKLKKQTATMLGRFIKMLNKLRSSVLVYTVAISDFGLYNLCV